MAEKWIRLYTYCPMAASVSPSRFPLPAFRQDPHWVKFKHLVAVCNEAAAARFLDESYRHKPIEEKLDLFLLELIDQRKGNEIACLAADMKHAGRTTDLARIAKVGAKILQNDSLQASIYLIQNGRVRSYAQQHAVQFRALGWEGRARFMDSIAAHPQ